MPGIDADTESLYTTARSQYAYFDPARKNAAFLENAGGSQVHLLHLKASKGQCVCMYIDNGLVCVTAFEVGMSHWGTLACMPQVPVCVADAVRDHLLHNCAQLGAGYALSRRSDAAVDAAHEVVKVPLLTLVALTTVVLLRVRSGAPLHRQALGSGSCILFA